MKLKNCKICERDFTPYKSTDKVCSYLCSVKLAEQVEIEKKHEELKKKVKDSDSIKLLTKLAKQLAQRYARLRDDELPCIACGTNKTMEWHGGHLFKSELYSGVRFDEFNIHKSCLKCNTWLHGNEVGYVAGFVSRYGNDAFFELYKKANETKTKKWTKEELKEIITRYKFKLKDYENRD